MLLFDFLEHTLIISLVLAGIVSVLSPFDYDTLSTTTVTIQYRVRDTYGWQDSDDLTIVFVNVNEAPILTIGTSTITVDEGAVREQLQITVR